MKEKFERFYEDLATLVMDWLRYLKWDFDQYAKSFTVSSLKYSKNNFRVPKPLQYLKESYIS